MVRAPFQVLVFPYRQRTDGEYEVAIFCRADGDYWQGISGGGEDDETPLDAAKRESFEEGGISPRSPYLALDTTASVMVAHFRDSYLWGENRYVIPEHSFGVEIGTHELIQSFEHTAVKWLPYAEAHQLLRYDSNRTAL